MALLVAGIAACNQGGAGARMIEKTLADGSHYTDLGDADGSYRTITRCWGKDCFQFSFTHGQIDEIERFQNWQEPYAPHAGYSCQFIALNHRNIATIRENIRNKDGEILISNEVLVSDAEKLAKPAFWTSKRVEDYVQANLGGLGSKHFNCYRVFETIEKGSPATLETTSITHDLMID